MERTLAGLRSVALLIRSNPRVRVDTLVAVVAVVASAGCGSHHAAGEQTTASWPQTQALEQARQVRLVVDGRRPKVDPASIVCWGVGPGKTRGGTRVWSRFDCIAPTFRGAAAGPDILFTLQPTGSRTFALRNVRLSSY